MSSGVYSGAISSRCILALTSLLANTLPLFPGTCSELLGPVASGVGDPAECDVAARPGHVGEDRAGEISSESGQRRVVRGANRDAVPVEFLGHAVGRDRLARDHAREEPPGAWAGSRELRPQLRLFSEVPQELGEPWRQQDGVAAQNMPGGFDRS